MSTRHGPSTSAQRSSARASYETRDARPGPLMVFFVALALILAATSGLAYWITDAYARRHGERSPSHPMSALRGAPEGPLLQPTTSDDLAELRASEAERLSSYGWIDRPSGVVRIPIERAMELLLERGLPVRSAEER